MRRARLVVLAPVALLAALLAAPSGVLAADAVTVTGTVVRDGAPVTGVAVVVTVTGGDVIASGNTDEGGAFSIDIEAIVGDQVQVSATGQTFRSEPDARGCVHTETPVGRLSTTLEAIPPAPLEVALDQLLTGTVCGATGSPRITPPATDALVGAHGGGSVSGGSLLLVLGVLALAGAGSWVLAARRR